MSAENTKRMDPSLFDRTMGPSISDYIVDGLKVIESLPYIKFTNWKLITDASKIDVKLNRKHLKNKAIQKDKEITKIESINDTASEMLITEFIIDYEGEVRYIKKELLIPAYVDSYHLLIEGNEILPIKQLVDMSTYNQKKSVKLKTTLTPIDLYKKPVKGDFTSTTGEAFRIKTFILNLFTKETNPLHYYAAKMGITKLINYFSMKNIIDIVDTEYDTNINHYFRINKTLFVEVDKRFFNESEFIRIFTYMVYNLFSARSKIETIDDIEYWVTKLGSTFTTNTKNQLNKGYNVLVSFGRILDDTTKRTLRLDMKHLQSTHSLIRWMLQNFEHLRKKDNHDMKNKRLRDNEVLAYYFIHSMSRRINNLLNKKKLSIDAIERIFNWNPEELFRLLIYGKSPCSLLRYNVDCNDFQAINALRVTTTGIQGLSGGKTVPDSHRDIYPSHIGRLDLNAVSHGTNTALGSMLVPTCKVYDLGFFTEETMDPDKFGHQMKILKDSLKNAPIDKRKAELDIMKTKSEKAREIAIMLETTKDENGCYKIAHPYKPLMHQDTGKFVISSRTAKVRTHRDVDGKLVTEGGKYVIKRRKDPLIENGKYPIRHRRRKPIESVNGLFRIKKREWLTTRIRKRNT